ncbi:MAG: Na+/H+ antiporter NhaA [Actinomycetota bacterium]
MSDETSFSSETIEVRPPWARSPRRVPRLIVRPLQQFLQTEASSGVLLLAASAAALIWANVSTTSYLTAWHTQVTVGVGRWAISQDLRHWINDGAMALFFLVVGLEIKRELVSGELRDRRAAALPAIAAVGGMVVPALLYLAITLGGAGSRGWGIPMATDIAFAAGILGVAGRGLPSGLRLFLLTLAIVDDIGAILVIAIFYSGSITLPPLVAALVLLGIIALLRRVDVRSGALYLVLGIGVWIAVLESGVHATIAGVALAFVIPAVAFQRPRAVSEEARRVADLTADDPTPPDVDAPHWLHLAGLSREAVSPLTRLQHALHPWTSYAIVPLFALANAGVRIRGDSLDSSVSLRIAAGVVVGLVAGKILGITFGALAATRLGLGRWPPGVDRTQTIGAAAVGGVGFTVSLFIAGLAFEDGTLLDAAKLGILVGSLISGVVGSVVLARARRSARPG